MLGLTTQGHNDRIDVGLFKIGVVDHGRLETVGWVPNVSDDFSVSVDHVEGSIEKVWFVRVTII